MDRNSALVDLCQKYNNEHEESKIDFEECKCDEDLIFSLWARKIDVGEFGFGNPYDKALEGWAIEIDDYTGEPIYILSKSYMYRCWYNSDKIPEFLCIALNLPEEASTKASVFKSLKEYVDNEAASRIGGLYVYTPLTQFNYIWSLLNKEPIISYDELRRILRSGELTRIQLCYLFFECNNFNVMVKEPYSIYDVIGED